MNKNISNPLIKADVYRLLSKGFSYPDKEMILGIKDIAKALEFHPDSNPDLKRKIAHLLKKVKPEDILLEYSNLFMKGNIPLTESSLCQKLNSITDVSAFYLAFGLKPASGEAADSLVYQLEFAGALLVKWVLAENQEQKDVTRQAYEKFFEEHLQITSMAFVKKLKEAHKIPFYEVLTEILDEHIKEENFQTGKGIAVV